MATEINAGRVAMVPKGEWSASTAYTRLDVVLYQGSAWVCIKDGTGQEPAQGSTYWQLLAAGITASDYYTKTQVDGILDNAEAWVHGEIDGISPERVRATWNASTSAYVSNVSVDTMYQSFYTDGKVLELELNNGSWDGSVLLCHGSYVDGNNARHLLFSGIVNGNLVEADVVGTAVAINFAEIADVLSDLQALWRGKQNVSPITNAASGALVVNEYRDFGSVSALTVTLTGGTMANYDLYKFAFTCASDATTLTLPSGVKLPVDMEMEMAAGRRFECVIDYANCLTFNCWD